MSVPFGPAQTLDLSFYEQPVEHVACSLLGAWLVVEHGHDKLTGIIVETEAYGGEDDLASHASFRRNGLVQWMYGAPGTIYVYKAYGMYPCFNVVTGPDGVPSAVLIRAVSLKHPVEDDRSASGPGRLGRKIGLDTAHNGHRLDRPPFWIAPGEPVVDGVETTLRVGVNRGDQRRWRFTVSGHPAVSRAHR